MKQIRGPPETLLTIVYFKHSQICSPAFCLLLVPPSALSDVQFHSLHLIIFIPVNPSDAIRALPSPGRKEHNAEQEAAESRTSPLTPGAVRIIHHPSQAYLKTTRRNCLTCWCLQFSEKPFVVIFSTGHVFDSLASCRPIRECFRVKRFIPHQTPASGARRCPVHHRGTCGFAARLSSKVLCCLAYFSSFSNGPLPN